MSVLLFRQSYSQLVEPKFISEPPAFNCDFCMCSQGISPLDFSGKGIRIDPRYLVIDRLVRNNEQIENTEGSYEKHFTLQLSAIYPLTKKISLIGIVPYSVREGRESIDENIIRTSGLGDVALFGRYFALEKQGRNTILLSVQAGIKFPTGKADEKTSDGELIDSHLQTGTGSTDFLLGSNFLFSVKRFALSSSFLLGIKTTGKTGYRFGNNLNYDVISRYRLFQSSVGKNMLFAAAGFRGEWRGREKQDGNYLENTGGNTTYLTAGFNFFFTPYLTLEAQYQLPVLYILNGTQEAESYRVSSGIQFIFY